MVSKYRWIPFFSFILLLSVVTSPASSAAVITPPFTKINETSAFGIGKSLNLASRTHCIMDTIRPPVPVSDQHCARALAHLHSRSDIDVVRTYSRLAKMPIRFTWPPCVIGMDRRPGGNSRLQISVRQVIMSAVSTLEICQAYGQGGWQHIEWDPNWIVFVEGL